MLFMVEMTVNLPPDMPADARAELLAREKAYSQGIQRDGRWMHLWRVAGRYANVSIFDVSSPDELHELVSGLPLFSYVSVRVTALAHHPSTIDRGEKS
jgi:muconolactone D-isomerase